MSKWFGESWGAPVCDPDDHIPTPVGETCPHCDVAIGVGDQGVMVPFWSDRTSIIPYHLNCFLATLGIHR